MVRSAREDPAASEAAPLPVVWWSAPGAGRRGVGPPLHPPDKGLVCPRVQPLRGRHEGQEL